MIPRMELRRKLSLRHGYRHYYNCAKCDKQVMLPNVPTSVAHRMLAMLGGMCGPCGRKQS